MEQKGSPRQSDEEAWVLPENWETVLAEVLSTPQWSKLMEFVERERRAGTVYPPPIQVFRALELTPYKDVRVVILGQDPYPTPGEAHGLSFSVPVGVPKPRSLKNIHAMLAL